MVHLASINTKKSFSTVPKISHILVVRIFGILTLLFTIFMVSCQRQSNIEEANNEGILIIGNSGEPKGLDPHLVSGVLESNIIRALFEGLCVEDPKKDGNSLPGVALSWEHNDDFTQWIFKLNPDAKWSDGESVTTDDFIFSYQRLLSPDPNWPAKYKGMLYFLKNAEAYSRNYYGHILCGNDPKFPVPWSILQKANFKGDKMIATSGLVEKEFSELSDEKKAAFSKYIGDEVVNFKKLNPSSYGNFSTDDKIRFFNALSYPEKQIHLNGIGIDKLSIEFLQIVKNDTNLVLWPEEVSKEVRQEVLDRIIAHLDANQPSLWNQAKVGVSATDKHTLVLSMRGPVPFLPELTKHYTWYPVPKHIILRHGKINTAFASQWTKPGNIVSNGPFQLKKWTTNHVLEVERNPQYWDAQTVSLNGIRYLPVTNYYTESRMFRDEQIHITYTVPSELIDYSKEHMPEMLRQENYVGTRFLRVNTRKGPLANPKFRRALALSIDQEAMCNKILRGGQKPASGVTPPFGGYDPPRFIEYAPERAKELLKESGFQTENKASVFDILTTNSETGLREAEALQAMWKQTLGLNVGIVQREWTTYLQKQYDADYDVAAAGWIGDYLDPTTFLEMWIAGGGNNSTGWSSQEFEDLLKEAENTANPRQRFEILIKAEKRLFQDTPILPTYFYTTNYLIRPEVKGWHPLLLNNHPFKFVSLETE